MAGVFVTFPGRLGHSGSRSHVGSFRQLAAVVEGREHGTKLEVDGAQERAFNQIYDRVSAQARQAPRPYDKEWPQKEERRPDILAASSRQGIQC